MRVKYTVLILIGFIFCCTANGFAQSQTIEGMVTDAQTDVPLVGVNILVVGTTTGTVTDANGHYSLNVSSLQDTLRLTYIGYQAQTVSINGRTTINIQMQPKIIQGEQLVVVGYGTQKKEVLTGSVSSISSETIEQAPVTNTTNALAGRLPGVITINSSGEPGYNGSSIRIRGNHSLNNNSPLIVIDGVPDRTGRFAHLDPDNISSISVLKDATAAIYGAEAANGVILVTTKSGSLEQAPVISVNLSQGFHQVARIPNMADAPTYMKMLNEINRYKGLSPVYSEKEIDAYNNPDRDPWLHPNTDWFRTVLKPWSTQNQGDISVAGGSSSTSYYFSLGGLSNDGDYQNSATRYNQINFNSDIESQVSKNINLSFNLSGRWEDRNFPTVPASSTFRMIVRGKPNEPAYFPNGLPGPDIENGYNPVVTGTTQTGYDHDQRYYLSGNVGLDIAIPSIEGLEITGKLSYNKEFQHVKTWQHSWMLYTFAKEAYKNKGGDPTQYLTGVPRGPSDPRLDESFYQQYQLMYNLVANYEHSFGNHNVKLMVGANREVFKWDNFSAFRRHFISQSIDELFAGGTKNWSNGGSAARGARQSLFGRANYNYKSKYLFQVVARYDGSYLFPIGTRYGFFPAFSGGWRISREPFFKNNIGFIDDLKIRASWGQTGNDILDPNALVERRQYLASYQFGGGYVFGNQLRKSIYQASTPNPAITWETSNMFDVGFDASMFNNRLSITFDYFSQMRKDILIQRNASVPKSTGLNLPRENLGKVKSWGYDGFIEWRESVNKDIAYNVRLNLGYSTDKIVYWDEPPGAPPYQQSTGKKINTGLYFKTIGVFQTEQDVKNYPHWPGARPGDLIFKDVNEDGKITGNDRIRINKNNTPEWTGGLRLGGSYKNFSLSVLFQASAGAVFYVATQSGTYGNYFASYAKDRWRPDMSVTNDPNGIVPDPSGVPYTGPRAYNRSEEYWSPLGPNRNTYFLRETNYVRLKNIRISYGLPDKILNQLGGIKKLQFYVSGFNLLTWDKLKVMDPEASDSGGLYYPQQRIFNIGMNLKF